MQQLWIKNELQCSRTSENEFTEVVLDRIPCTDKALQVPFRCSYANLKTTTCNPFYCSDGLKRSGTLDNKIIVHFTVTEEVAEALQSWIGGIYMPGFRVPSRTKGFLCQYYPSGKLKCRLKVEGVFPVEVLIKDSLSFPERKDIEMTLSVDSFYLVEHNAPTTPLFVSEDAHSVLYRLSYKNNFTNKTVHEVFVSLEDAELRRDEVSDTGASISELLINAVELE